jgi:anti-anti-sigma factor
MLISREKGGVLLVTLSGRIGGPDMEQLAAAVMRGLEAGIVRYVLLMDSVTHADYRSLEGLKPLSDAVLARGAEMRITGLSRYVRDIIRFVGVDAHIRILATLQQALESLGAAPTRLTAESRRTVERKFMYAGAR